MLDYFSFARAKKNKADLEKTNPKTPVLNDEDEQFLQRITTEESAAPPLPPTVISDAGEEKQVESEEQAKEAETAGTVALPTSPAPEDTKPGEQEPSSTETTKEVETTTSAQDEPKEVQGSGLTAEEKTEDTPKDGLPQQPKKTWASYVPSMPSLPAVSVPTWSTKVRFDFRDSLSQCTNSVVRVKTNSQQVAAKAQKIRKEYRSKKT